MPTLLFHSKRPLAVRASLAWLVLGCIVPMAAVSAYLIVDFYARERTQIINNTVGQARAVMAAVDRDFDSTQAALQALATSRLLQDGDMAGFHAQAREALVNLRADSIVVVGADGALLLSTRRPYGAELPRLPATPLLKRILETGKPGVSDLFLGPLAGQQIYTIGVPLRRDGRVEMSLNATAAPDALGALLMQQQLPPDWRAAILDRNGRVAARSHDIQRFLGLKVSQALSNALAGASEGVLESRTLDGIPVLTVYSRSPASGWSAALGIPLDVLTGGLRRSLTWLVVVTLAALAAGLALAWRIGGGIAGSVHALIGPAMAVGRGEVQVLPPLAIREAVALGAALQSAAASVRAAQAATRESEQRLALVADAAHLGIWVRDLLRQEIWVSDTWRELFGFAPGEAVTLAALLQRVHPDDRAAVQRTLNLSGLQGSRYDIEFRVELPDGAVRWIGSHGSVEWSSDGNPALVRGVSLDISKRKLAELDVQQKRKEVMHLARVAMLGELSGALAHELNQPLTAILSNAQAAQRFLRREPPELGEVDEILQDIVDEDQRAGEIIRRLRRLFGNRETMRQQVSANELVVGVVRILRNDLLNHGVALSVELAPAPLVLQADEVQLQQVLINLLVNACDAMVAAADGGRAITVRVAAEPDEQLHISVSDCGPGIAPAVLERLFEPFYTTKENGMGLGLSICRGIVGAHGGRLWAENGAQGGAVFHLCLPLAMAVEEAL
jgi:PAS domain S-box-containing protein